MDVAAFLDAIQCRDSYHDQLEYVKELPSREGQYAEPASPLPAGTKLEVTEADGVWRFVSVLDVVDGDMDVEGWVHGRYVAPLA